MSDIVTYYNGNPIKLIYNGDGSYSLATKEGNEAATGGSKTTLVDSNKNFDADMLINKVVVMEIDGVKYYRTITDNDSNTLTFATLPGAKASVSIGAGDNGTVTIELDVEWVS